MVKTKAQTLILWQKPTNNRIKEVIKVGWACKEQRPECKRKLKHEISNKISSDKINISKQM